MKIYTSFCHTQAEGRDHKRWIDRFNSKLREKAKKEETKRMKAFVEAAFGVDPRMVRRRAEEKAAKCAPTAYVPPHSHG